MRKLDKSEIP